MRGGGEPTTTFTEGLNNLQIFAIINSVREGLIFCYNIINFKTGRHYA